MCMCTHMPVSHDTCVKVRGQFAGVSSLLEPRDQIQVIRPGSKGPHLLNHLTGPLHYFLKDGKRVLIEGIPSGSCKPQMMVNDIPSGNIPTS